MIIPRLLPKNCQSLPIAIEESDITTDTEARRSGKNQSADYADFTDFKNPDSELCFKGLIGVICEICGLLFPGARSMSGRN
jgi:hypothetical protein